MNDAARPTLVEKRYLSYDDLSVIEPDAFMEMGGLSTGQVNTIIEEAESRAEKESQD